jgi:hypothetical protein
VEEKFAGLFSKMKFQNQNKTKGFSVASLSFACGKNCRHFDFPNEV